MDLISVIKDYQSPATIGVMLLLLYEIHHIRLDFAVLKKGFEDFKDNIVGNLKDLKGEIKELKDRVYKLEGDK